MSLLKTYCNFLYNLSCVFKIFILAKRILFRNNKYSHFLKDVLYFSLNLYTVFNPPTTVINIKSRPTSPLKK